MDQPEEDPIINARMEKIADHLRMQRKEINPFILEYFKDPDLFNSLPETIRSSDKKLLEFLENSGRFNDIIYQERQKRQSGDASGLFGEKVNIPETEHASGKKRKTESGHRINVAYLKTKGIDPSKVLFFRITQPTDNPKPEYYWTSDYSEVQKGLTAEISPEQRKTSIILVADLETINGNGGLIQDFNDDNGLAVRQIGIESFDQKLALTIIRPGI